MRKIPEQLERYKKQFIDRAVTNDVPKYTAEGICEDVIRFGACWFNKSYATVYGLIAYQTACLKANHTALTCEVCGQQRTMRDDLWVTVRCDRCYGR